MVEAGQRKARRAEIAAQSRIDKADDDLDDLVYEFGEALDDLDSARGRRATSACAIPMEGCGMRRVTPCSRLGQRARRFLPRSGPDWTTRKKRLARRRARP